MPLFLLFAPGAADAQIATGSYLGNGMDNRAITGLDFQPNAVIIKGVDPLTPPGGVMRTSTMAGDATKPLIVTGPLSANMIQSLDPGGFTIGTDATVNSNGLTYYWTAFRTGANVVVGQYTGNQPAANLTPQAIAGLAFSPEYLIILGEGSRRALHRTNLGGALARRFDASGFPINDAITSLDPTGFTVQNATSSSSNCMNVTGEVYDYIAWNAAAGQMAVGQYNGDGTDNRNITGLGFRPGYVIVGSITAALSPHQRSDKMPADASVNFQNTIISDRLQNLLADGFQVGTRDDVNGNTTPACSAVLPCTYTWAAFAAPTVNYRSIGTNAGTLYSTGNASVTVGSLTVTLAGGACIPANVGQGDQLTFTGAPAETLYILSRDSTTQLTLQGAAASTHTNQTYTITRAYTTLAAWETAREGDLVTGNRSEVGVAYNDGPFTAGVTIDGSTTDATHYLKLTVPPFHRHNGRAGTGVVISGAPVGIRVLDDYTRVEWFEIKSFQGANGNAGAKAQDASNVLFQHLLIHDFFDAGFTTYGIELEDNSTSTLVRNCIIYDGGGGVNPAGIRGRGTPPITATIENNTVFKMAGAGSRGVYEGPGVFTVRNTIAMNNPQGDFDVVNGTQSNNLSSDTSASGAGSLTSKLAANQFASIAAGAEDLHLKSGAEAINAGTTRAGFTVDVDGDGRPGLTTAWDIGADEKGTVNFRSIGTNGGTLYGTGNASVTAGTTIVTFGGGASLPANVGQGDVLTFTGGPVETLNILVRDSATQVRVQSAAASSHTNQTYTITRAFTDFAVWETARQGDLATDNRIEVAVAYNDAPFVYSLGAVAALEIDGSITSANCYMKVTAAQGQRHTGKESTGVVLDGTGSTQIGVRVLDNYAVVEGLELKGFHGFSGSAGVSSNANNVLFDGLIVHGFFNGTIDAIGIRTGSGSIAPPPGLLYTARNCIVYDGDQFGIRVADCDANVIVENCTVYNIRGTAPARGVNASAGGSMTVTNTISMGNVGPAFQATSGGTMTQSYNMSSDATAAGTGSLINKVAANQFVEITITPWDFHLKAGADALNVASDLTATSRFSDDIDNQSRPAGAWDMGADERDGTTAVRLTSFEAVGRDGAVELSWRTGSELDNLGFHLYRSLSEAGPWTRITQSLIPGLGSSPLGQAYAFRDTGLTNGILYVYRLEDVDASSKTTSHGPVSAVPTAASSGAGDSGDASKKRKGTAAASCPDWVLSAYGSIAGASASTATLRCTRHGDPEAVSLGVISRDARQATLELRTGGFYALHEASGGVRVFVPGFDFPEDAQAAALPFRRALVDAMVGRRVQLGGVRALDQVSFSGLVPNALGKAEMQVSWDGTVRAGRRAARALKSPRSSSDLARLLPSVFQGEAKSAVVEISPLRFDAGRGQLLLAKRVQVRLLFTGREPGESGRGNVGRAPRSRKPISEELLARLYTKSLGLHAVSFEALFPGQRRGFAASELSLERQGQPVGFHIEPASASFEPGSHLYFYADTTTGSTDFSSETAWELVRARDGISMPLVSVAPAGNVLSSASMARASFEVNRFYQPGLLEASDLWLWEGLASGATRAKSFSLGGVATAGAQTAELEVQLQGASESGNAVDHHVSVSVNGALVGETQFAGKRPYRMSLSLPASLVREGQNELSVTNVADTGVSSLVFLDRFKVSFPQTSSLASGVFEGTWNESGTVTLAGQSAPIALLDVTAAPGAGASWLAGYEATGGSLRFRAEAGRRYLAVSEPALISPRVAAPAASSLRSTANQADYLLIAPRAFLSTVEPLVERRRDQGLQARGVSFEEISDEFGHGQPTAEAIKSFLSYAFQSWTRPSPRYVLLVGDSNYDPRNFTGVSLPSPLPALWTKTSYLWTVSDPQLAAVNGEDALPDLAIGRLPATTLEEAQRLLDKLVAWEDSGQGLAGRAALVADNPDLAGDFEADIDDVAQSFLPGREVTTLKLSQLGAGTRGAIRDALDSGLSLLSYVGHGGAAVWASENVWNSWDAPSLQAQSQQPLLLTLNCLNGYFVAPTFDSLAESLLKAEGRAAIAAISPSGLSLDGPAHQYHRALMAELTRGQHARLGDALLAAQKAYAQTGLMPELLNIYQLLGDPAMPIR